MKTLWISFFTFSMISVASAATVLNARLNETQTHILIDIQYAGGCEPHEFRFEMREACLESDPVQCFADLIEISDDPCDALIRDTVSVSLSEHGLNQPYFRRAKLTIYGGAEKGDEPSSAVVHLP